MGYCKSDCPLGTNECCMNCTEINLCDYVCNEVNRCKSPEDCDDYVKEDE